MFSGFEIGVVDAVQIVVLAFAIYAVTDNVRGTKAGQVLLGFLKFVLLPGLLIRLFNLDVLGHIFFWVVVALAVGLLVVFQDELRRGFAMIGQRRMFGAPGVAVPRAVPEVLVASLKILAQKRLGALIALERGISLVSYEDSGIRLDARVSAELLISIFTPPLPLHDGGIVIRSGRLSAAHCIFPVSNREELITSGMRHRAAVGLSEETDAVVLVVSEERGIVSIAHNGRLIPCVGDEGEKALRRWIAKSMPDQVVRRFRLMDRIVDSALGLIGRNASRPKKKQKRGKDHVQ